MMMEITVREASEALGVSLQTIYRWVARHKELNRVKLLRKKNRQISFNADEMSFLRGLTNVKPTSESTGKAEENPTLISALNAHITTLSHELTEVRNTLNTVIDSQTSERLRHDTIIQGLTRELSDTRKRLEDLSQAKEEKVSPPPTPRKSSVVPLRPEAPAEPHPMASWTPLQLLAIKFFQPWKLRRDYRDKKAA